MSFQVPTIAELNAAIVADLEAVFGQTIPIWAKAFLRVLPKSLAGKLGILYKYAGSIFLQQFVQFAGTEEIVILGKRLIPLVEWGRLTGTGDPTAATRAEMVVDITVTNQTGSLPINTQYVNINNNVTYLTLAEVALDASTVQATIRAYSDQDGNGGKGVQGNLEVGNTVSLVTPNPNVVTDAVVASINVTAANAEEWEVYRSRVSDRFRKQPQGGAYADYEQWGESVEGIINAYPYTGDPGQVNVYSEATVASSGSDDGIPTGAQLTAVFDAIEVDDAGLASRRPVGAFVNSLPITRKGFDVVVSELTGETDTATLQTKVEEALVQYFLSREPFIPGLTLGYRRDRVTAAEVAGAIQDTASAYGGVFSNSILSETGGDDVIVYSLDEGEKAKLTTVTFV